MPLHAVAPKSADADDAAHHTLARQSQMKIDDELFELKLPRQMAIAKTDRRAAALLG